MMNINAVNRTHCRCIIGTVTLKATGFRWYLPVFNHISAQNIAARSPLSPDAVKDMTLERWSSMSAAQRWQFSKRA